MVVNKEILMKIKNKVISTATAFVMLASISAMPVYAMDATTDNIATLTSNSEAYASNYFSRSTGTMNSVQGSQSKVFNISSGSISPYSETSGVKLDVRVSNGSSPFYIVVEAPNGDTVKTKVTRSGSITLDEFNNGSPKGTWNVYITGSSYVSTATAKLTVNYTY